uniref:Putative tail protein n=2 Tax=viral metagenome TaxID=1070528 RepID=A0A6M3KS12_9ZZZZ
MWETTIQNDDGVDVRYQAAQHPGTEGLRLAQRLFAVAGPALAPLLDTARRSGLDAEIDLGGIVSALADAASSVDGPALVGDLLRYVVRDGVPLRNTGAIDVAYGANYGELAEALAWIVERNGFARFFSRLAARAGAKIGG